MQNDNDTQKPKRRGKTGLQQRKGSPYWWASFIDASGKRIRKSTETADRKEAEALLAKWRLEEFEVRQWDREPTRTFDELMFQYLKETIYRRRSGPHPVLVHARRLYQSFTGKTMNDLSTQDVRAYIRKRRTEGVKAATINKEVGLLASAINYARKEWGWELHNSAAGCREREDEGRVRWISRAEAARLIQEAGRDPRANHLPAFVRLAANTGMRAGEMLGLEWSRVDLSRNLLFLEAEHTKTKKRRSIPLNQEARAALLDRARFRATHCPGSQWVFCTGDGERMKSVKTAFRTALKRSGITTCGTLARPGW